jgi:hypothetical protein
MVDQLNHKHHACRYTAHPQEERRKQAGEGQVSSGHVRGFLFIGLCCRPYPFPVGIHGFKSYVNAGLRHLAVITCLRPLHLKMFSGLMGCLWASCPKQKSRCNQRALGNFK